MDCPCCFEIITASTGQASLSCGHSFHITCLTNWFVQRASQELDQNCPCCRKDAGEKERLSTGSEEGEVSDDGGSEYSEDDEEVMLTRAELDAALKRQGAIGIVDSHWFTYFDEDEPARTDPEHRLPFVWHELNQMAVYQGGRQFSEEEWEELLPEEDAPAVASAPVQRLSLTHAEFEDEVVWPNGGIGCSPEQWAELVLNGVQAVHSARNPGAELAANQGGLPGNPRVSFTRAEIDAYLLREEVRRDASHALTDSEWDNLYAGFAQGHYEPPAPDVVEEPVRLQIRLWRRRPSGEWERTILNPETDEPASWGVTSSSPPPDELVEQCSEAALKFQAVWRSYKERETVNVARALLMLGGD